MSRNLHANTVTESPAAGLRPVLFVQLYFPSGWLYLWSGYGSKSWNGQTWTGTGNLGKVSPLTENADTVAEGVQLSLSGIPASLVTSALSEVRQGSPAYIYQGFLTSAEAVVADPFLSFSGRMDSCSIAEGADTVTITINVESRLLNMKRSRERRFTHDDQQIEFPGDLGFEFVAALQEMSLGGGGKQVPTSTNPVGGGGAQPVPGNFQGNSGEWYDAEEDIPAWDQP